MYFICELKFTKVWEDAVVGLQKRASLLCLVSVSWVQSLKISAPFFSAL